MKKKILCLTMVMCVIMTLFSVVFATESAITNGTCGDNLTWSYDAETQILTISGEGNMYDYASTSVPWYDFCEDIIQIELDDGVTSIGSYAFADCKSLKCIFMTNSVKVIGNSAIPTHRLDYFCFYGIKDDFLKIEIADGNDSLYEIFIIDFVVFSGSCGDNVIWTYDEDTRILTISGEGDMYDYTSNSIPWYDYRKTIEKIVVEEGITSIGNRAFSGCAATTISLPETLKSIGEYSFNCSVESIELPDSLEIIEDAAFFNSGLTEITIPKGVSSIGAEVFLFCNDLEEINVAEDNHNFASIDGNLYSKNKSTFIMYAFGKKESEFTVPDGVTEIYDYAFSGNTNIVDVVLPDGIERIGKSAFEMCENLESVNLPSGLTVIDEYAFSGCTSLSKVSIPGSVKNISEHSFSGCQSLGELVIVGGVESIGYGSFYGCSSLESLVLPNSVNSIGEYAFESCRKLKSVVIPNSVKTISDSAFDNCRDLTDVYYTGTEEEWEEITIGEDNEPLTEAMIHYNYVPDEIAYGDATGDGTINVNDVVLLVEYIGTIAAGGDFDVSKLPGGTDCLDVTGDGAINVNDAVLLTEYIGTIASGGTLDETKFPGGTFPGAAK